MTKDNLRSFISRAAAEAAELYFEPVRTLFEREYSRVASVTLGDDHLASITRHFMMAPVGHVSTLAEGQPYTLSIDVLDVETTV